MSPVTDEQRELYGAYSVKYATEANRRRTAFWVDLAFAVAAGLIAVLAAIDAGESVVDFLSAWSPPAALFWLAIRESGLITDDREHRRAAVRIQEQFDLTFWKADRWREAWNGGSFAEIPFSNAPSRTWLSNIRVNRSTRGTGWTPPG